MVRKIPFEGDDGSYIEFLESQVLQLQKILQTGLHQTSQQHTDNHTPPRNPANVTERRDQDEAFETPHCNTFQFQTASESQIHSHNIQAVPEDLTENRNLRKGDGGLTALKIIEYDQEAHYDRDDNDECAGSQGKEIQQPKTLSIFTAFLDDLPRLEVWKTWVLTFDHNTRRKFLQELVQTCGPSTSSFAPLTTSKALTNVSSNSVNITILSKCANFMISIGSLNRQLACFLDVLFVSICAVALKTTQDKANVYKEMRKIFGSHISLKQLAKLVRGAKWANSFISLLSETKWASMSWDVLCVAEHPVSFYARFNDCSLKPEAILNEMKTNIYEGTILSDCSDEPAPFAIPLIIKAIFGDSHSLQVICKSLGYKLSSIQPYQDLFHGALHEGYVSKKRPGLTSAETSKRHCRDRATEYPQLLKVQDDINSQIMAQYQSQYNCIRDGNTPTTDSPLSQDIPGRLSQLGHSLPATREPRHQGFSQENQAPTNLSVRDRRFTRLQSPENSENNMELWDLQARPGNTVHESPGILAGDAFINADVPDFAGDPFMNADFPDFAGDPFINADFPDFAGDPFINADFPDFAGDPFTNASLPDVAN